ncbi:MAG: hypothetical protein DELT_01786 [Desulfovibrio sp.]
MASGRGGPFPENFLHPLEAFLSFFKVYYNMIRIFRPGKGTAHSVSRFRAMTFIVSAFMLLLFPTVSAANEGSPLPPNVQKCVTALLAMRKADAPLPDKALFEEFLSYTTSAVNLTAPGEKPPAPAKLGKASGILWRARLQAPLATTLEYLYNPKVPTEVVYPASVRYARWQAGSDILTLQTPLWKQFGQHTDTPLVLRGTEREEITPDTNSSAYYSYTLDRVLILTEHKGRQMLISLAWQKDKSDVGKKAAVIGDYSNWDFVYSGVKGTLAKGIGWAETFIYASTSISIFYEDAPGGNGTGYAMYRWMDAGWSGMNMVKGHHMKDGAERSFKGLKAFLESPKRPAASAIAAHTAALEKMDVAALREVFKPYSVKVEEAAATVEALKTEDFQKVIQNAGYGDSLSKNELIAALNVNYIKEQLGKPLLAGPLTAKP